MIINRVLKNGVRLLAEPVAETGVFAAGFWFPYGSRFEVFGGKGRSTRGAAHFIEHMLFKGTSSMSSLDIAKEFEKYGGYVNAFTEREMVCLHCLVPGTVFDRALEILCNMVSDSVFSQQEYDREYPVIESEIISSLDDSEEVALDGFLQAVYPGQSISKNIAGSVYELSFLTREVLYSLYCEYFKYGELTVSLAGSFDFDAAASILERLLPARKENSLKIDDLIWRSGKFFLKSEFQQYQLFLGFPIPKLENQRQFILWSVFDSVVGDTMASRLFQALREKKGLCYNVYSSTSFCRNGGIWNIYAGFPGDKTGEIVKTVFEQLVLLKKSGISEEELGFGMRHISGEIVISMTDMEYRMKRLGRQFYDYGEVFDYDCVFETLESVVSSEVNFLAERYLDFSKASLIVIGEKNLLKNKFKQKPVYEDGALNSFINCGFVSLKLSKEGYYE